MFEFFKKKKIFILAIILIFIFIIFQFSTSFGMQYYSNVDFSTGLVKTSILNVRSGPGTEYKIIGTVCRNEYVNVLASIEDWYIVQIKGDYVGAVSKQYIKPIYPSTSNSGNTGSSSGTGTSSGGTSQTSSMNSDEKEVFNLINQQRTNNGLSSLKVDNELQRVAKLKAQDIVNNNYFAHESPTYGTPFDMLKNYKINYKTAGENLAGNSTNQAVVDAWMNSPGHEANILNNSYNYTGIAVLNSKKYGKIYVQMFIGKYNFKIDKFKIKY